MNEYDDILEAHQRAERVHLILGKLRFPLKNVRRLRELREIGVRDWLHVQLGMAARHNDHEAQKQIIGIFETLSRKRGRPRIKKPTPHAIGRPKKYTKEYLEDWLMELGDLTHDEHYKNWLKDNNWRNSQKLRILYTLERIIAAQGQRDVKSKARSRLRTFENIISSARQLSRKPVK